MYVSDRPKRPNMVPKPNLGGDFTFLHRRPLDWGVLSFALTMTTPPGVEMKFNSNVLLGHN